MWYSVLGCGCRHMHIVPWSEQRTFFGVLGDLQGWQIYLWQVQQSWSSIKTRECTKFPFSHAIHFNILCWWILFIYTFFISARAHSLSPKGPSFSFGLFAPHVLIDNQSMFTTPCPSFSAACKIISAILMIHSKVCGPTGDNNDSQVIGELATLLIASLRQIVFIARALESPVYIFFSIHL